MLAKYDEYIHKIQAYIDSCFAAQEPYICCKEGCAMCCETGLYPISQLEFAYMKLGMSKLHPEILGKISNNISTAKKLQQNENNTEKFYKCPFLVDKKCCIYEHRGLVCRSYGLLIFSDDDKATAPCCASLGLNYSQVYDVAEKKISQAMLDNSGINTEPLSYNLSYKVLQNNSYTNELNFGECKALIDWFE